VATSVAVLGTGTMGGAMARNLARAGLDVRAWNPSRGRAEGLGASVCASPAEAVRGADFVLTMAPDAEAVEETMFGEGGAAAAMRDDGIWLQCATVGVEGAERLGELAAEHGVVYVDAPVLGTKEPAEKGELTVLASGPESVRERSGEVFDAVGKETVWLGEAGAGSRMKMVTNAWLAAVVEGAAETIALAQALGVDARRFLALVEGGPIDSPYLQLKGKAILDGELEPSFSLEHAHKDVELVLEAARGAGVELRLHEAISGRFERAIELGHGREDWAATYFATAPG